MNIRVFRCPAGKGEYRVLYNRIVDAGWLVLSVRKQDVTGEWLIRCADKEWFCRLRYEQQVAVARGQTTMMTGEIV
jgi:hypothetical protein